MKVAELSKKINAKEFVRSDFNRTVDGIYIGDFLSNVMGKAKDSDAWFTVMNNINVCAVASLVNVAVVVLCEGVEPSDELIEKCKRQQINLISTELNSYNAITEIKL